MAKWIEYFKIVTPAPNPKRMTDNQYLGDQGTYNNYSWYQRLIQGSASRISRYREYDLMDADVEVARALDTISEEITGNDTQLDDPLNIELTIENQEQTNSTTVMTLKTALRKWCQIHDWENRLFKVARITAKYGDCFFRKQKGNQKWAFIHPKNVLAAIVDEEDVTKVLGWQVKKDITEAQGSYGVPVQGSTGGDSTQTEIVPAVEMVRFGLHDDLSDTAPFGESVLRPAYRAFKQKELIEDAIIIYRVQRAPERRVFYIDVGKMPAQRVKQYLEGIKNEIKQKKVPTINGGQSSIDSVYNPQSMSEDFFFATRPDGKGSRVDTLPGGQNLGELSDLKYFEDRVWRALRVPASYMQGQRTDGALFNDGKLGVAFIEELRFALFIHRLQGYIQRPLDEEFKKYLRNNNIIIDESIYRVRLPDPSNFGIYRQQELDAALLGSYGSADGIQYLSKRFALKRYLNLTEEELILNERLLREEKGLDPDEPKPEDIPLLYGEGAGLGAEGGFGGGFGGMPGGLGGEMGEETLGPEEMSPGEELPGGAGGQELEMVAGKTETKSPATPS